MRLDIPAGASFLIVTNQGIDSVAKLASANSKTISQSATWRGRIGTYVLDLQDQNAAVVLIESFELLVAPGNVDIHWVYPGDITDRSESTGLSRLSAAANFRLSYGETGMDSRLRAMDYYQEALELLDNTSHDYLLPDIHFEIASVLLSLSRLQEAKESFEESLKLFAIDENVAGEAASYMLLGMVYRRMASRPRALEFYQSALERYTELGDLIGSGVVYNNIGVTESINDNYEQAREPYYQALVLLSGTDIADIEDVLNLDADSIRQKGNLPLFINTLNNLAGVEDSLGNVDQAESLWRSTLRLNTQVSQKEFIFRSEFYLGRMLTEQGRFDEALELLDSAAAYFQTYNDGSWYNQSLVWLGNLYANVTDYEQARISYEQVLGLSTKGGQQHANVLRRLASINWAQGSHSLADTQYQEALRVYESLSLRSSVATVRSEYSQLQHQAGQLDEAYDGQINAMNSLRELGQRREAARAQSRLGQMYASDSEYILAEQHLRNALDEHRAVGDELYELDTLMALANMQSGQMALVTIAEATELASSMQLRTMAPALQSSFLASRRTAFERHMDLLLGTDQVEAAWQISEKIRARSLLDLVQHAEATNKTHQESRGELLEELQASDNTERKLALQRKLNILDSRDRRLNDTFETDQPLFSPVSLQEGLDNDTAVLSYFLGEHHSHLWTITNGDVKHFNLSGAEKINTIAASLSTALRSQRQSPAQIHYLTRELSELILPDGVLDNQYTELVILADSNLHLVPFGLLPLSTRDSSMPGDSMVLLDQAKITYAPSARLYQLLSQKADLDGGNLLVLADPLSTNRDKYEQRTSLLAQRALQQTAMNLEQLPGAQIEARSIANKLSLSGSGSLNNWSLETRVGNQANEAFVASGNLADYDIIHFATHGVVDAEFPGLSGLVLASEPNSEKAITYLRPHQIAGLDLGAELVVLSGCETGIGKSLTGEGPMSLSRPFFIAGAKQVISSLWKVSDQATAQLMEQFYHNLLVEEMSASEALREAQLWMREHDMWWHPYFWAGFTVQGGKLEMAAGSAMLTAQS